MNDKDVRKTIEDYALYVSQLEDAISILTEHRKKDMQFAFSAGFGHGWKHGAHKTEGSIANEPVKFGPSMVTVCMEAFHDWYKNLVVGCISDYINKKSQENE